MRLVDSIGFHYQVRTAVQPRRSETRCAPASVAPLTRRLGTEWSTATAWRGHPAFRWLQYLGCKTGVREVSSRTPEAGGGGNIRGKDGSEIRWSRGRHRFRPAAQPGRGGGDRGGREPERQLIPHLPLLQHLFVLLGLQERMSALPPDQGKGERCGAANAGGAPLAGLPVDHPGAAGLLLGCGDWFVAGHRLLPQAELPVVGPDPVLRASALGSGPDPELQVVCAGLHWGRSGLRGGAE